MIVRQVQDQEDGEDERTRRCLETFANKVGRKDSRRRTASLLGHPDI